MASKRGIAATAGILAAVTAASFAAWAVPAGQQQDVRHGGFGERMERSAEVNAAVLDAAAAGLAAAASGGAGPGAYAAEAEAAAAQLRAEISEMVSADVPAGWRGAHAAHLEALRASNAYVREAAAAAADPGGPAAERAAELLAAAVAARDGALAARPGGPAAGPGP